jgi:hypothetical protein
LFIPLISAISQPGGKMNEVKETIGIKNSCLCITINGISLPLFRSHKIVGALKIKQIDMPRGLIIFDDPHYMAQDMGEKWVNEKQAKKGGYFVVYEDGYVSFSPAGVFEKGYTLLIPEEPLSDKVDDAADDEPTRNTNFRKELKNLINCHSMENGSNTPDFILAEYLGESLHLYDKTVNRRDEWHGVKLESHFTEKADIGDGPETPSDGIHYDG